MPSAAISALSAAAEDDDRPRTATIAATPIAMPTADRPALSFRVLRPTTASRRQLSGVTEREREVLTLVGRGMSNKEIAGSLSISAATAKAHVARLLAKLGAPDRVQLVIVAYGAGLVPQSIPDSGTSPDSGT